MVGSQKTIASVRIVYSVFPPPWEFDQNEFLSENEEFFITHNTYAWYAFTNWYQWRTIWSKIQLAMIPQGDLTKNRTEQNTRETVTMLKYKRDLSRTICVIYSPKRGQSLRGTKLIVIVYLLQPKIYLCTTLLMFPSGVFIDQEVQFLVGRVSIIILDSNCQGKTPPWDRNLYEHNIMSPFPIKKIGFIPRASIPWYYFRIICNL